jgi:MinD superfamily P-loop ATPase
MDNPPDTDANIVTGPPVPAGCPDLGRVVRTCAHWHCPTVIHIDVNRRGQRRRFCSTRCRVAEHRRLS